MFCAYEHTHACVHVCVRTSTRVPRVVCVCCLSWAGMARLRPLFPEPRAVWSVCREAGRGGCRRSWHTVPSPSPAWSVPCLTPPPHPLFCPLLGAASSPGVRGVPCKCGSCSPVLGSCPLCLLLLAGCSHVRGRAGTESRLHPVSGDSHLRSPASLAGSFGPLQAGGDSGEGPHCGFWSPAALGSPRPPGRQSLDLPSVCVLHVTYT